MGDVKLLPYYMGRLAIDDEAAVLANAEGDDTIFILMDVVKKT